MTNERLAQLRGNLANLRDSTDDYRAEVLAQDAIHRCDDVTVLLLASAGGGFSYNRNVMIRVLDGQLDRLADALGIAPDVDVQL